MANLTMPEYIDPIIEFQDYQTLILCSIAIFPNMYFLHRCIKYKLFSKRKYFKVMTMIMSSQYIVNSTVHILFCGYLIICYHTNIKVNVKNCSKFNIFDVSNDQILIITPFYLHFFRFWFVVINKKTRYFVAIFIMIIIITIGPIIYIDIGQYFEINIYYIPKSGCGYQIFSHLPFYTEIIHFNSFVIFILPIILIFINYLIYQYAAKKMSNNNKSKMAECRRILKGLIVQGLFTLIFQVPQLIYLIYYRMG
uniref:G_PROTEIN_RECEP_F1_2 domain-containing protein n=1 Tax=Strongyloides venezuelensis TaxID=75913 RepID=A0A0K0F0X1_STRVS